LFFITGRYVPGMIATIFSFVDKIISSLASTIVGLMLGWIASLIAMKFYKLDDQYIAQI
jgi:hypothetical protein